MLQKGLSSKDLKIQVSLGWIHSNYDMQKKKKTISIFNAIISTGEQFVTFMIAQKDLTRLFLTQQKSL